MSKSLMKYNSDTEECIIYSKYTGAEVFAGKLPFKLAHKLETAIRETEKIAFHEAFERLKNNLTYPVIEKLNDGNMSL